MFNTHGWPVIIISIIIALILTILPMPEWSGWLRPAWVLMVLMYWTISLPYIANIGMAWLVGVILDVLSGTLLGEHALALTVVIYVVSRMQSRLHMFPLLQQALSVFFLVFLYQFIIYCVQGFVGQLPHGWLYWSSAVTSMVLWPWVYSIMRNCRRRFKVA